ncbi:tyrosine-type recombinase/integrase [Methylobacterium oxalidis]|uniref:Integrase n=1 Tax=Methylobacterium oxalidis TaxID=944322 RepID=A0A512JB81_9HYPH|nr:site-specific integrase [Methylobacterium oxalidis]GEP07213.1 integrase [Methylobacterium oxalidis]GJE31920.1 Prophage integrase IntA [Methylobacterium oxalidis]GLS67637.1 integrase [Methylobacterium oxalidis]
MAARITETLVKSLPSPERGNRITYDTELKGFGVRITAAGAKSFILNYRIAGRERRYTIGSYPEWSATAARKEAEGLKRQIDRGEDPMAKRSEERETATIAELCALYEERHLPKKRPNSQRDDRVFIRNVILPRWGREKVTAIRHTDIEALHREVSARAPYRANRLVALLSKMFSLAVKWELTKENPVTGIERNPERMRTRYLSADELQRLQEALDLYPNQQVANAIRLLLLTGSRRMEVLSATWDQFNLKAGIWIKPAASVKQAREHRVPLSAAALELLTNMKGSSQGRWLFPGKVAGKPLGDIKKAWASICRQAGLEDIRLHDLRHSFASYLASAGHSLPVIGALLGHTQAQTTHRYAHLLDEALRGATDQVGMLWERRGAS